MPYISLLFALFILGVAAPALAGESPFGYVYTTDTHPQGVRELEQWITRHHGQARGDFDLWQGRTEIEYGITDRLQSALYLNYNSVSAFRNRPDDTTGPGAFVPDDVDPGARRYHACRVLHFAGVLARHLYGEVV